MAMRIVIDGRPLQEALWGGVGLYTFNLLRAIFSLDKENEYHIFYNARKKFYTPEFKDYANVMVHHFQWPNRFFNLSLRYLRRPKIDQLILGKDGCDVFFMPNLNFSALSLDMKFVMVVHDLSFEHFHECFSYKTRLWHSLINPRALLQRADHIIAISEHTRNDLNETYQVPQFKMSVVYPGLTIDPVDGVKDDGVISDTLLSVGSNYILYFGALDARKNLPSLIEAYELYAEKHRGLLPNAIPAANPEVRLQNSDSSSPYCQFNTPRHSRHFSHEPPGFRDESAFGNSPHGDGEALPNLVLAGASGGITRCLKKQIVKSKFKNKIFLLENPSEAEKRSLYSKAALFVYPSFYEGFGFPPLEAMAYGVPAIVSSTSSMPEVCGEAAFLVNPWNIVEIKEGIRIMLQDSALRQRYIEAGKKRLEQFSWQKCAQAVLNVFDGFRS